MQYLVLGATGYVGNYIYQHMKRDGFTVLGTGHRNGEKDLVCFDALADSIFNIAKVLEGKEKMAIICIAQTDFNRCKTEYKLSRQINVIAIKSMIEVLVQEKFQVIYFSTDNVFDGVQGNYTEQDKTNAISKYGEMKEEIELFLTESYPEVCIYRMPRVVGVEREERNLLTDFERKITDKVIKCIKGNRMSIVAKEDILQACYIASKRKLHGIYNLSNGETFSRKELAEKFFYSIGIFDKCIVELELEEFGFKDVRPLNTSLDNTKFRKETGYEFRTYDMIIDKYLKINGYK